MSRKDRLKLEVVRRENDAIVNSGERLGPQASYEIIITVQFTIQHKSLFLQQ